jgi:hypothetical protein
MITAASTARPNPRIVRMDADGFSWTLDESASKSLRAVAGEHFHELDATLPLLLPRRSVHLAFPGVGR